MAKSRKKKVELHGVHIACYTRLSIEDTNAREHNAIETQKKIIEHFVKENFQAYDSLTVYEDCGFSGVNSNRPRFLELLEDIEQGRINCVVVKDLSRIGRNYIDVGYYVEKYFPLKSVRLIAINDTYDSQYQSSDLVVSFKNVLNEAYVLELSKKVKAVKKRQRQEGKYIGTNPPFGYKKSAENSHQLVVNPDTIAVVQRIFQLAYEGHSISAIARMLERDQTPTPSMYLLQENPSSKVRVTEFWNTGTIRKILKSEMYIGHMVQGVRTTSRPNQEALAKKEDWSIIKNTHEPIISEALFDAVQEKMMVLSEKNKSAFSNHIRNHDKNYVPFENIFKHKLFCRQCGEKVLANSVVVDTKNHTGRIMRYSCGKKHLDKANRCKPYGGMNDKILISVVGAVLEQHIAVVFGGDLATMRNIKERKTELRKIEKEMIKHKVAVEKLKQESMRLFEQYVAGALEEATYHELCCTNDRQIDSAQAQYDDMAHAKNKTALELQELAKLKNEVGAVDFELTAEMVHRFIKRISIAKGEVDIEFAFESPYV